MVSSAPVRPACRARPSSPSPNDPAARGDLGLHRLRADQLLHLPAASSALRSGPTAATIPPLRWRCSLSTTYTDFAYVYSLATDPQSKSISSVAPSTRMSANGLRDELEEPIVANGEPNPTIPLLHSTHKSARPRNKRRLKVSSEKRLFEEYEPSLWKSHCFEKVIACMFKSERVSEEADGSRGHILNGRRPMSKRVPQRRR